MSAIVVFGHLGLFESVSVLRSCQPLSVLVHMSEGVGSDRSLREKKRLDYKILHSVGEKIEKESEARPYKLQGALKSPLSGDSNHPGPEQMSSKGLGPAPVARGGV